MPEFSAMQVIREEDLFDALSGGETMLLAATVPLSQDWKRRVVCAEDGAVCSTPAVSGWSQWLNMLATEVGDIPVALGGLQELLLWEQVIGTDRSIVSGASLRGLARHASQAVALMQEYGIEAAELAGQGEEADALLRWLKQMRRQLQDMQRSLACDVAHLLLPHISGLVRYRRVVLDGFQTFTPTQQAVLKALQDAGASLERVAPPHVATGIGLTACSDAEAEYAHVAGRVAGYLQEHPSARIAIAISGQVGDTDALRRHLDAQLAPGASLSDGMQSVQMAGTPLSSAPLVRQMLHLLQLAGSPGATFAEMSPLLFSPGLSGYADERQARAMLDASLRASGRHYVAFKALLASGDLQGMPRLAGVLKTMLRWSSAPRSSGEWANAVHGLLQAAGYLRAESKANPDTALRSNADVRQLNAFRECLASLVAADAVSSPMEWPRFLSLLSAACQAEAFKLPALLPQVQVLQLSQMSGLRFDAVFAVGIDEQALPLPVQTAPFIPFPVQRAHGLPNATAALAFEASVYQWAQVLQAAPRVFVSYARHRQEGELHASPLLGDLPVDACAEQTAESARIEVETFADAPDVPVQSGETVRGGSGIVKNQSACAFRAFATHRLGLVPLGTPEPGIDAAAKGSLIHLALEYIWTNLASQAELLALDEDAVSRLVESAISHAHASLRSPLPDSLRAFESERMRRVLLEWLQQERERPAFRVEHCEKSYLFQLPEGGRVTFPVKLKADRIDRDGEGRSILIDYKTGRKQSIGEWTGERMREPQLPLYSMAEGLGADDAVCFARVRSGEMGFEGLSGADTGIKGVAVYKGSDEEAQDWPALLDVWRRHINRLAAEFVAGRTRVAPRDARACNYCGLEAVCRIDEIGFSSEHGDDEEDA